MSHEHNKMPPVRCPHGFLARLSDEGLDGWVLPRAPEDCVICKLHDWRGPRFKSQAAMDEEENEKRFLEAFKGWGT